MDECNLTPFGPCRPVMPPRSGTSPPWAIGAPGPHYPPLATSLDVDVAVIGAGITGLTGGYLAARAGRSVVVLERDSIAGGETGRTTGFLTAVLDARLVDLVAVHGEGRARAAWDSSAKGVDLIEAAVRQESLDCDFRRVDAYLYGPRARDRELLKREARWANEFGYAAEPVPPGSIPFSCRAALRIPGQARVHPLKYMLGLARAIRAHGGRVHERTNVRRLKLGPASRRRVLVRTDDPKVYLRAGAVLLSNNAPFVDRRRMYARLRPCRTYAMAAPIAHGKVPEGLFWNTLDPYDYARLDVGPRNDRLILGGADHGVGQVGQPERAEAKVEAYWTKSLGRPPSHPVRWSGEILNSEDGLPFIGVNPGSPTREMIATGFGGNGLTLGTLAGWMFCERVLGRATRWDQMYDPNRGAASTARTEIGRRRRLPARQGTRVVRSPEDLAVGEGAWYVQRGRRLSLYRVDSRTYRAIDPRCTHLGCSVEWNPVERSWDCPCHGSRFDVDGRVLDGPAFRPLKVVNLRPRGALAERPRKKDAGPA